MLFNRDEYTAFIVLATFDRFIGQMLTDNTDCYTNDAFKQNEGVVNFLRFFYDHTENVAKIYDLY